MRFDLRSLRLSIGRRPLQHGAKTARVANSPDWFRREGMALTGSLTEELASGTYRRPVLIEPGSDEPRVPFLIADAIDPAFAAFADRFADPSFSRFRPLPVRCADLGTGHVCGIDGIVFTGGRIVRETTTNLCPWKDVEGFESYQSEVSVCFRNDLRFFRKVIAGEFLVGFTSTWPNYAHWMKECVPRLVTFMLLRMHRRGLKLVLPPFSVGSFHQATLDLLGISEEWIYRMQPRCVVTFENLTAAFGIDIIDVSPLMARAGWLIRSAHAVRHSIEDRGDLRRIYLHRGSAQVRQVENFDVCRPLIESAGFVIENFDDMPLHDQIARMRSASCLVAEHGAGLANMLFCEPGTPVAELFSPATVQPAFWSLASRCGLPFGFMVGDPVDDVPSWNGNYVLDPAKLQAVLTVVAAAERRH